LRLRAAWTYEHQGLDAPGALSPEYVEAFRRWWQRERDQRITWVAEAAAEPVGMLNMLVFTRMPSPGRPLSQWGYVANVYVRPEHRGNGLGRRLLDAATAHADDHGFARLVLSPSPRSVRLYERAGFAADARLMTRT